MWSEMHYELDGKADTLADENGQERLIRVDDEWLYKNGIDEGSCWPKTVY